MHLVVIGAVAAVVVVVAGGLLGCAGRERSQPLAAIDAYAAALERKDPAGAYRLMSASYRREHTVEDFGRLLAEHPADVRETVRRLRQAKRRVELTASLPYGDLGAELLLVHEGTDWRLANNPLEFYPQGTPRQTLRSFLRAAELGRFDVLLRFVPAVWAKEMTVEKLTAELIGPKRQELEDVVRALRSATDAPIEEVGEQARMSYGERFELRFVREEGIWKIEDFD